MKVIGIRYCGISEHAEAIAKFLGAGLGLPEKDLGMGSDGFSGAVFPAGESWIEFWPVGPEMPASTMLQIVVDDADAWAERARAGGLKPNGPVDAHGERIYSLVAPGGLHLTFQSALSRGESS